MLRLSLATVLFLSTMAVAQAVTPADAPVPAPILCNVPDDCAQNPAKTAPEDSILADLPNAPGASSNGPNAAAGASDHIASRVAFVPSPVDSNTSQARRILDRQFALLQMFSAAALVTDVETTVHLAQQPNSAELNPLYGRHPTRGRLYGIAVPLDALSFYMSYHYKKIEPKRSLWKVGPGISIAVHTAAAINNIILAHR